MPTVATQWFVLLTKPTPLVAGMIITIGELGFLELNRIAGAGTQLVVTNPGYPENVEPGTVAPAGSLVLAAGARGATGEQGPPGLPSESDVDKAYVDAADALRLEKVGGTLTGDLTIHKATAQVIFEGQGGALLFRTSDAANRFLFAYLEAGPGDIWFQAYGDTATNSVFRVARATGTVDFGSRPTVSGNALALQSELFSPWEPFVPDQGWENNSLRHRLIWDGSSVQFSGRISGGIGANQQAQVGILAPIYRPVITKNFVVSIYVTTISLGVGLLEIRPNGQVLITPLSSMETLTVDVVYPLD